MNPAERNPWRHEFARRISDFDVGLAGRVRQAIKATEDASPPMAGGRGRSLPALQLAATG
jgi:hypothetical protein